MATETQSPSANGVNGDSEDVLSSSLELETLSPSQKMKRKLTFKPTILPKKASLHDLLKKIPLLSGFIRNVGRASNSIGKIAEIDAHLSDAFETAGRGFSFTEIILLAIDFLRIPVIYLASVLLGEKPPITLSNNAKWLYAAILLGLAVTAFALPIIAPIIALAAASFALTVALFTMGKMFYQRYQLRKSLKTLESDIARETEELNSLHDETEKTEKQLKEALLIKSNNNEPTSTLTTQLDDLTTRFDRLFDSKKGPLQTLHDKKFQYEQKLKNKGTDAVMDKGISVVLIAMAVTGLAISLFFPPIGAGIIAASAILGALYLASRVTFPFIKQLFVNKTSLNESESIKASDEPKDHLELQSKTTLSTSNTPDASIEPEYQVIESTGIAMTLLVGKTGAAHALQHQASNNKWLNKTHANLMVIVSNHDTRALLKFFAQLSLHVQSISPPATTDDVRHIFNTFQEMEPPIPLSPIISLMKDSISAVQAVQTGLSEQEKSDLLACPPLEIFLQEQGVELQTLAPDHAALQKNGPGPGS